MHGCKIGMWTCIFALCGSCCNECEDASHYLENEEALRVEFETEEDYLDYLEKQ